MTKLFLILSIFGTLLFSACSEKPKQENKETATIESLVELTDDIVEVTSTDKDGKQLDITFNNTKGIATVNLNGDTIELSQEKTASGIWYKNDSYELRGKGNEIELTKDGKHLFEKKDDIVNNSLINEDGETLDMIFNNTGGTVKVYLNGGVQIDLVAEKAASGIWYINDSFELRGKADKLELKKNGEIVFKN